MGQRQEPELAQKMRACSRNVLLRIFGEETAAAMSPVKIAAMSPVKIKAGEVVDARLWSKDAALENTGKSIGMFVERTGVMSGGAPLTDLTEDETFELRSMRRALRAPGHVAAEDVGRVT